MDIVDVGVFPVRSFVVPIVRGATRAQERARHCLAARSPAVPFREQQLLLERLSQSSAFETPRYQRGTARPLAAAVDLPGLVMTAL